VALDGINHVGNPNQFHRQSRSWHRETLGGAAFCPPNNQSAARESVSQKIFSADQEMADRMKDYFKRNLSLETPRATIRRTISMVRFTDETAQCFRNESFVN
jgi:hypothetical protein